jgi:hypothetical protein
LTRSNNKTILEDSFEDDKIYHEKSLKGGRSRNPLDSSNQDIPESIENEWKAKSPIYLNQFISK